MSRRAREVARAFMGTIIPPHGIHQLNTSPDPLPNRCPMYPQSTLISATQLVATNDMNGVVNTLAQESESA